MIFLYFIIVFAYIAVIFFICKNTIVNLELDLHQQLKNVSHRCYVLKAKKKELDARKVELQTEANEIFVLYELMKDITKSISQQEAFNIFKQKLKEHVRFRECRFIPVTDNKSDIHAGKGEFVFLLRAREEQIGRLLIRGASPEDEDKIVILAHQFALALRRVSLYQKIERVAITDNLTGVNTRRYALSRFREEIKRSSMRRIKLSFLMVDIDLFKKCNDKYGHLTGDKILREVGSIIKTNIREIDIAGRYGGEEFCIILPDTDRQGAMYVAERIRKAVEASKIRVYDAVVKVTLSIGISTFPYDGKEEETLIDKADWALYRAKKLGRNRVCVFDENQI